MPRVKTGTVRRTRHKKVLKATSGYRMTRNRLYKVAHEALLHAGEYAFAGRKQKKRTFRKIWIIRLNAALHNQASPISYSRFINLIKQKKINLNRKILSEIAFHQPSLFTQIFKFVTK
jgi:large subunit ribosomal protein L20